MGGPIGNVIQFDSSGIGRAFGVNTETGKLWISQDRGLSWAINRTAPPYLREFQSHPHKPRTVFAADNATYYRSDDLITWVPLANRLSSLHLDPQQPRRIWASNDQDILRSDDEGKSWAVSRKGLIGQISGCGSLLVLPWDGGSAWSFNGTNWSETDDSFKYINYGAACRACAVRNDGSFVAKYDRVGKLLWRRNYLSSAALAVGPTHSITTAYALRLFGAAAAVRDADGKLLLVSSLPTGNPYPYPVSHVDSKGGFTSGGPNIAGVLGYWWINRWNPDGTPSYARQYYECRILGLEPTTGRTIIGNKEAVWILDEKGGVDSELLAARDIQSLIFAKNGDVLATGTGWLARFPRGSSTPKWRVALPSDESFGIAETAPSEQRAI